MSGGSSRLSASSSMRRSRAMSSVLPSGWLRMLSSTALTPSAEGVNAVLLNIRSQPDGSTLDIARDLRIELEALKRELPPDMKLAFFYDQSQIVRESVRSVWEAIIF